MSHNAKSLKYIFMIVKYDLYILDRFNVIHPKNVNGLTNVLNF